MTRVLTVAAGVLVCVSVAQAGERTVQETMTSDGASRTYYLFVPDRAKDNPSPLIILLHGSGRDGKILVDHWRTTITAARQGSTRAHGPS